jgi:hypothetical protein
MKELKIESLTQASALLGMDRKSILKLRNGESKVSMHLAQHIRALRCLPAWRIHNLTRIGLTVRQRRSGQ